MTPVIKWVFILVLAAVTAVTIITIMTNQMETERMPEDEKLNEITSAGHLMAPYNSSHQNEDGDWKDEGAVE